MVADIEVSYENQRCGVYFYPKNASEAALMPPAFLTDCAIKRLRNLRTRWRWGER